MQDGSVRQALHSQTINVDLQTSSLLSFDSRLRSIHSARHQIDLMYYLWREDTSGIILLKELLDAADRGVRVRIILDALNFLGSESLFVGLDQHPNIEVRLYNPFRYGFIGGIFKFVEFLFRASRLNRRLHNKCWLVDGQVAISGGRNIGDEYFGRRTTSNFSDLDTCITGEVVKHFEECFAQFWNNSYVKKISRIRGLHAQTSFNEFRDRVNSLKVAADSTGFAQLLRDHTQRNLPQNPFTVNINDIRVVWDPPEKTNPKKQKRSTVMEVFELISSADSDICLISPYFVPGPNGSKALKNAARRTRNVRVLTNSLSATDALAAHSGAIKYRKSMLESGVSLYELKPTGKMHKRLGILPKSRASLHAKVIVIDRKRSFVGSFNLDPRSAWLNCEMGVVIQNADFAKAILDLYSEASLPVNSWKIECERGHLVWRGENETGAPEKFTSEPEASPFKIFTVWLFSLMPIEPLL